MKNNIDQTKKSNLSATSNPELFKLPPSLAKIVEDANRYFDQNPPRAHSQTELDRIFKRK